MVEPINIGIFTVENFYEPQGGAFNSIQAEISASEDEGDSAIKACLARQNDVYSVCRKVTFSIYIIYGLHKLLDR